MKASSASNKQYIVLVLRPNLTVPAQSPQASSNSQDKSNADFLEGYFMVPKAKRALEEDYCSSVTPRKGSGVINIKLPHCGAAAGVRYEVRGVDVTGFLCICNCKIKIDQARLLEDGSSLAYSRTVQQLLELKSDGNKYPPALDPKKGMTMSQQT